MKKKYIAYPEYLKMKGNEELYELEHIAHKKVTEVVEHRVDQYGEEYWTQALPQTLLSILNSWDKNAAMVAAKSYLSKQEEIIEVEK